jgi:50S ribosomal protein L16 3-hydroxylase
VADEVDGRWEGFERDFLLKYWQKRPVLIRNFIPDILREVDIGPEMLIELAMDEDVESRVVVRTNSNKWKKKSGPFTTTDFQHLQADR